VGGRKEMVTYVEVFFGMAALVLALGVAARLIIDKLTTKYMKDDEE
jgi:hypothetical protein